MSEREAIPAAPLRKSKAKKIFRLLFSTIAVAVIAEQVWYHHKFPYGWSHCCDIGLGFSLLIYAQDHGGRFPTGGDCPEASLSLMYSNYVDADLLRGKTVPLEAVKNALAKNGKLGPESCGWHYVAGLTLSDDPRIAIVWDKVGLGHNGERIKGGGRPVILVDGSRTFISGAAWPRFLQDQQDLLAHRSKEAVQGLPALTATIRLPSGEILTNYSGDYEITTGSGSEGGSNLELQWYHIYEDGPVTWTLTLPGKQIRSKPVTLTIKDGRASPSSIVFEMEKY